MTVFFFKHSAEKARELKEAELRRVSPCLLNAVLTYYKNVVNQEVINYKEEIWGN